MSRFRACALLLVSLSLLLPPAPAYSQSRVKPQVRHSRASAPRSLPARINALLGDAETARAFWGIEIVSLDTGKPLYSLNPERLFTPASNTKLFTTAAALALLGGDYRFRTTVEVNAAPDSQGRVHGDLVLVGRGDPNLSGRVLPYDGKTVRVPPQLRRLEELADQVAQKGVKVVEGGVVGDDTFFVYERFAPGWSQDNLIWSDGAPVSALALNDNIIFLDVLPGASVGKPAALLFDPDTPFFEVDNRITTTTAGSGPRTIAIDRQPGSSVLTLWGSIPLDSAATGVALAMDDPAEFAARTFRKMLESRGIEVKGQPRALHAYRYSLPIPKAGELLNGLTEGGGAEDAGAQNRESRGRPAANESGPGRVALTERVSEPLIEDLRVTNKVSQNLHAEIVLRLLGREKGTAPTREAALVVMKNFLAEIGIEPTEYVFFDGSGLSRENLVSPGAIVKLLRFASAQPWAELYESTLAVAGVDGSLGDRMKDNGTRGHIHAKTGTLNHVSALSGYADTASGKRLAFSILVNNHQLTARGAQKIIDQMVQAMVDDKPPARKPAKRRNRSKKE